MQPKKPKILLITQYYLPDLTAASFRMQDLAVALRECGCDVTVITSYPHRAVTAGMTTGHDEGKIIRIRIPKAGKGYLSRINNYVYFAVVSAVKALTAARGSYDVVMVSSPPLFLAFTGYVVSKIKRARYIVDVRDIWPDSAVAASMLKEGSLLHKFFLLVERFFYRSAHHVICVTNSMKEHIAAYRDKKDISVVYNGFSHDIAANGAQVVRAQVIDGNDMTIAYVGNIGMVQGLEILLEAVAAMQKEQRGFPIRLRFIGDGVQKQQLAGRVRQLGLKNVEFVGVVSHKDLAQYLYDVQVLFLHLLGHPVLTKTIPSKLFDYLLFNKPIIAGIKGEGREILERLGCGLVFEPENREQLINCIKTIRDNYDVYLKRASNNRDYVINNFDRITSFKKVFRGNQGGLVTNDQGDGSPGSGNQGPEGRFFRFGNRKNRPSGYPGSGSRVPLVREK